MRVRFPPESVAAARRAIEKAIDEEIRTEGRAPAFGIAAGANGGDLLFHDICRDKGIPTRMCLALRKPQYVGQNVAQAGREWVEKFLDLYRYISGHLEERGVPRDDTHKSGMRDDYRIHVFTEVSELPRWLQGKPLYNVGRRNNQWMLQHAIAAAHELGPDTEITLLALWDENASHEFGVGGISDLTRKAALQGIKVVSIPIPPPQPALGAHDDASVGEAPEKAEPAQAVIAEGKVRDKGSRPRDRRQAPPVSLPTTDART
jgi:hypothetical protein